MVSVSLNHSFDISFTPPDDGSVAQVLHDGKATAVEIHAPAPLYSAAHCTGQPTIWALQLLLHCTRLILDLPDDSTLLAWQLTRHPLAQATVMGYGYYTEHIVRDGIKPWPHPEVLLVSDPAQQPLSSPAQRAVSAVRLAPAQGESTTVPPDGYAGVYLHAVHDRNVIAPWQSKRASAFLYGICVDPPSSTDCVATAPPSKMTIEMKHIDSAAGAANMSALAVSVCREQLLALWASRGLNGSVSLDVSLTAVPCLLRLQDARLAAAVSLEFDVKAQVQDVPACTSGPRTLLWGLDTCPLAGTLGTPHPLTSAAAGADPTAGTLAGGDAAAGGVPAFRKTAELSPGHVPQIPLGQAASLTASLDFISDATDSQPSHLSVPQNATMVARMVVCAVLLLVLVGCVAYLWLAASRRGTHWVLLHAQLTLIATGMIMGQFVLNLMQVLMVSSWVQSGSSQEQRRRLFVFSRLAFDAQVVGVVLLMLVLGTGFQSSWWLPLSCSSTRREAGRAAVATHGSCTRCRAGSTCCVCTLPPGLHVGAAVRSVLRQLLIVLLYIIVVLLQRVMLPPPVQPVLLDAGGGATSPLLWKDQYALALDSTWTTFGSDMSGADWLHLLASAGGFCAGGGTTAPSTATCHAPGNVTSLPQALQAVVAASNAAPSQLSLGSFPSSSRTDSVALGAANFNTYWQWAAGTAVSTPDPTQEHVVLSVLQTVFPSLTGALFFIMILDIPNTLMAYLRALDVHSGTIFAHMQRASLNSAHSPHDIVQQQDVMPFLPHFAQRQVFRKVFLGFACMQVLYIITWILSWLPALMLRFPVVIYVLEEIALAGFLVDFAWVTRPAVIRLHPLIQAGISEHLTRLLKAKLTESATNDARCSPGGVGYPSHLRMQASSSTKRPIRGLMTLLLPTGLKQELQRPDAPGPATDTATQSPSGALPTIGPTMSVRSNSSGSAGDSPVPVELRVVRESPSQAEPTDPSRRLQWAVDVARAEAVHAVRSASSNREQSRQELDAIAWPWVHVPAQLATHLPARSHGSAVHMPHETEASADSQFSVVDAVTTSRTGGGLSLPGWTPPELISSDDSGSASSPNRSPWREREGPAVPWSLVPLSIVRLPASLLSPAPVSPAAPPNASHQFTANASTVDGGSALNIDDSLQSEVGGAMPMPAGVTQELSQPPSPPAVQGGAGGVAPAAVSAWVSWQALHRTWKSASGVIMRRGPRVYPKQCGLQLLILSRGVARRWMTARMPSRTQEGQDSAQTLVPTHQRDLSMASGSRDGSYVVTPREAASSGQRPTHNARRAEVNTQDTVEQPARDGLRSWTGGLPELHVQLSVPSVVCAPGSQILLGSRLATLPAEDLTNYMDHAFGRTTPAYRQARAVFVGFSDPARGRLTRRAARYDARRNALSVPHPRLPASHAEESDSDSQDGAFTGAFSSDLPWRALHPPFPLTPGLEGDEPSQAQVVRQINEYLRSILSAQEAPEAPPGGEPAHWQVARASDRGDLTAQGQGAAAAAHAERHSGSPARRTSTDMSDLSMDTIALHSAMLRMLLGTSVRSFQDSSAAEYQLAGAQVIASAGHATAGLHQQRLFADVRLPGGSSRSLADSPRHEQADDGHLAEQSAPRNDIQGHQDDNN